MTITPLAEVADPRERLNVVLSRLAEEAHRRGWVHFYDRVMKEVNVEQVVNVRKYKGVVTVTLDTQAGDSDLEKQFRDAGFNEARYITVRRRFEFVRTEKSLGECNCPKSASEWEPHKDFLLGELQRTMPASRITLDKKDRVTSTCNYCAPDKEAANTPQDAVA